MNLHTRKRMHIYNWDEFTTDEYLIERVEILVESEK